MSAPTDLGLQPAPDLAALEAAILARLEEQSVANDGPLRTIEPYQGQLIEWSKQRGFKGPAVLVYFDEAENTPRSNYGWDEAISIAFFVGVVNYRGPTAARVGAASEVGALALLQLIFSLFAGWDLEVDGVKPLEPVRWASIIAPEARLDVPFAVYRYDFLLPFHRPRPTAADVDAAATHLLTVSTLDLEGGPTGDDEGEADLTFNTDHPAS